MSSISSIEGLTLEQLLAFDRVLRHGSFSRAALALGLGQPAISSRIQALEQALGGAVFRRGRRIKLTALGESFTPYVKRALDVLAEGVHAARGSQEGKRGRVTLGALPSLAGALVGAALAQFIAENPDVDCFVRAGEHEALLALLLDGIIELALVAWPCPPALEPELRALFVLEEPVLLVAGDGHPLAKRKRASVEEVLALARPLYRLRWWPAHHPTIESLVERSGHTLDLPLESALHLVRAGRGAGFFPRLLVADALAARELVVVGVRDLPAITRSAALVCHLRTSPLSPAATKFVALLRAEAERLAFVRKTTLSMVGGPRLGT